MIKKVFFLLAVVIITLAIPNSIKAESDFETRANIEYKFHEDGKATVTNTITLKNKKVEKFSKSYVLDINYLNPQNIKAFEKGRELHVERSFNGERVKVEIIFDEAVFGLGRERTFAITYETDELSKKLGDVREITIPRVEDQTQFDNYSISLLVDNTFGDLAYISPGFDSKEETAKFKKYRFSKDAVKSSNISAGFGHFQSYAFTLKYHLQNEKTENNTYEFAIPPDTSIQRVFYKSIEPKPKNVYADNDGNWICAYHLKPKQKIEVEVKGVVQIYPTPREFLAPEPGYVLETTKEQNFWPVYDNDIKSLAKALKSPENIYNFVVNKLTYDTNRVKPDVVRLGAKEALKNPSSATCMEFTDLFITIVRAIGIPAREINGYAHTENPEVEPLSLVSDVLHAWPEYWDSNKKVWIPVDPTWESTSKGTDYFSKLDLRHFAFVIHGANSTQPYPAGAYKLSSDPKKDIFITYSNEGEIAQENINIDFSIQPPLNMFKKKLLVHVLNEGTFAKYNFETEIYFDNKLKNIEYVRLLPPMGKHEIEVDVNYGLFGMKAPDKINIRIDAKQFDIDSGKKKAIIYQLLTVSLLLLVILLSIIIRIKNLNLKKIFIKIVKNATKKTKNLKRKY